MTQKTPKLSNAIKIKELEKERDRILVDLLRGNHDYGLIRIDLQELEYIYSEIFFLTPEQ